MSLQIIPLIAMPLCFGLMMAAPAKRPLARVVAETGLLVAIGSFLLWRGASLLPGAAERDEPWIRALSVIWWLGAARLVVTLFSALVARGRRARSERLFTDLAQAAVYLTAILFVLNSVLDLPIKGLLATSGVIAVVLGLALQNTLADVFAGIAVGVEKPFDVGDQVCLGDHVEGVVVQLNWRSVRVQQGGSDLAIIPNSVVAKGQIINRSKPTNRRTGSVTIAIDSPLAPEALIALIRQALLLCPDLLPNPAPAIHLTRLDANGMVFTISFSVATTPELENATSLVLRQISRSLRFAGARTGEAPDVPRVLAELAIFDSLNKEQIAGLAANIVARNLNPGEIMFGEGSRATSLFVIQTGVLEVARWAGTSKASELGHIGPGEYIGEISLFTGNTRRVTVTALTACRVLELPRDAIESLVHTNPAISEALERSVRRGLAHLDRDEAARSAHPKEQEYQLLDRIRAFFGRRTAEPHLKHRVCSAA